MSAPLEDYALIGDCETAVLFPGRVRSIGSTGPDSTRPLALLRSSARPSMAGG
jgi:hypothetical protein